MSEVDREIVVWIPRESQLPRYPIIRSPAHATKLSTSTLASTRLPLRRYVTRPHRLALRVRVVYRHPIIPGRRRVIVPLPSRG